MTSTTALDTAAAAVQACADLAGGQWDQVEDSLLPEAAVAIARIRAYADAALVEVAEQLEATGAADKLGWATTKDFLTHLLGGHKGTGATYLRVAKQTADLPHVREAMTAGEVSLAQASVIGSNVAKLPHVDDLREQAAGKLLDLAVGEQRDATDLDHAIGDVIHDLDPDGTLLAWDTEKDKAERSAHRARYLSFTKDKLGGYKIKGYGTAEDTELVKTALMPLAAPVVTEPGACGGEPDHTKWRDPETGQAITHGCPDPDCRHDGRDPRESGARLFDALVEAARRLQATDSLPHAHGTTARITITTSLDALTTRLTETGHLDTDGHLPSGDRLSATAVRRLACDAEIIPTVLGTPGQILDIGRTTRTVPTAIWNALVLRDRHCAFPGCNRLPIACDAHHIHHWADGGTTALHNLILLCRKHHTAIHRTPWTVAIDDDTGRPAWTPPPPIDTSNRWSFTPARARPPTRAA
ncbi:hypothetical protein HNR19_001836 [Nocardioides thalensis]|uniref:HNH nuclease domain-containing protein n=1 Tax=Nocardioides thalensis TaxID=1914755 RepID=A0A853C3I3_9ACTN|nr:HNH endonuclease signature motif containing protein [Nocardioides thalensis]NYJ01138.1 hypothetical protein [Nocardioides thalensis]